MFVIHEVAAVREASRASLPLQHDQDAKDRSLRKRTWVAPRLDTFACCRTLQQRLCPFAERVHVGSCRGPPSYPLWAPSL